MYIVYVRIWYYISSESHASIRMDARLGAVTRVKVDNLAQ
jgi:hypothetical protein